MTTQDTLEDMIVRDRIEKRKLNERRIKNCEDLDQLIRKLKDRKNVIDNRIRDEKNKHIDKFACLSVDQTYKIQVPNRTIPPFEIEVLSIDVGYSLGDEGFEIVYKTIELEYTQKGNRKKYLRKREFGHDMILRSKVNQITKNQ